MPIRPGPAIEQPYARSQTVAAPLTDPCAVLTEQERRVLVSVCRGVPINASYDLCIQYQHLKNILTTIYWKLGIDRGQNKRKATRACHALGLHEGRHERDDAKPPDALYRATS